MLLELHIENFAIIEKLVVSFEEGLTVFTGETGAGKSIIIDAIGLLAGGRGSSEYVRHGTKKAEIEALFEIDADHVVLSTLEQLGIDPNDHMLILNRQISNQGKSICRVNGKLVTLSNLKDIGHKLIDIHGQHEHQSLLNQDRHMALLDQFGGSKLAKVKSDYQLLYRHVSELYKEMMKFNQDEQKLAQRLDLLTYQINEINDAKLQIGEEEALIEEKRKLMNYEKVFQALQSSYESLNGEQKALDWLRQTMNHLETIQSLDQDLHRFYEAVSNSYYLLEENASSLRDYFDQMEYQPERLNQIEARLNEIHLLKRKYGQNIHEILAYYTRIKQEWEDLSNHDHKMEELTKDFNDHLLQLSDKGNILTKYRKRTANQLNKAINRELKDLYMENATFEVLIEQPLRLENFSDFQKDGIDKVTFLITTNPGEPLKPLAKVASGGELSRVMLAIKSNFKEVMGVTSIIFDEVDTGVSGRVAQAMAEKIYQLSKASQVFCITHLPQVAAMADHHLYISKDVSHNKRTKTQVHSLDQEQKVREIGRMISGVEMTDLTKQHAEELLSLASQMKNL
ncbi:DNA repair protein RecN [Terrilactibacillus sp. BCM23-1]|uniref:DNA repair protein RecN n=1 Tax=Terrilactibacillus tamarindi TaxID=2599694 RepID=A0A6N8CUF4_9BACI|nr:DNA repair protein RecN [Terrilactibacillus tamarindi]MTT32695.1 DNA repair protein RecN [Terrilactibacillus tamarindi]